MDNDKANSDEPIHLRETRRRVWWTLVLCEWIPIPYHAPCISDGDFQVELPASFDDHELQSGDPSPGDHPRPIQYHIVMIQMARVYHRFRASLKLCGDRTKEVANLVLKTDEELANIIEDLPLHLQGGQATDQQTLFQDRNEPWVPWQRTNLSLVLFYYRIVVNRVLQDQWVQDPATFARTRAICVGSARGIVSLASEFTRSLARHRPW